MWLGLGLGLGLGPGLVGGGSGRGSDVTFVAAVSTAEQVAEEVEGWAARGTAPASGWVTHLRGGPVATDIKEMTSCYRYQRDDEQDKKSQMLESATCCGCPRNSAEIKRNSKRHTVRTVVRSPAQKYSSQT